MLSAASLKGFRPAHSLHSLTLFVILSLLATPGVMAGLTQQYCSSQNTADTPSSQSIYQSLGLCRTTCQANFAIAVVRGHSCWCSNYIPEDITPLSNCSSKCPGYPYEDCGNDDNELFGYSVINEEGILGKSGARSSTSKTSPTSEPPSTTAESSSVDVIPLPALSTTSSSAQATSKSSTSTATWTPSKVTAVLTRTISNKPVTQTVTSGPTPLSNGEAPGSGNGAVAEKDSKSGTSGGLIAGVVVGTIAGMALLGAALFFLWRRRRQHQAEAEAGSGPVQVGGGRPKRNTSVLSKTGLLGSVTPVSGIRGHFNHQGQGVGGAARPDMTERRSSRPLYYDQRLNPAALLDIDNNSRVSVNTIPDNRDFSRPLNVTNPDV